MSNRLCIFCNKVLKTRHQIKFCSSRCQCDHNHNIFIDAWKEGLVDGMIGVSTRVTSNHIRRYLIETHGEKCSLCGWNKIHSITKKVPLDLDHIDGNSENNNEKNLRLLCPNCHSLTPFFRALNMGHGRKWRIEKYRSEMKIAQTISTSS
jgi:predicted HNH restriction endonuclease